MGCEGHCLRIQFEVHARVVEKGCLVDVDIQAVVSAHLEGCLHSVHRIWSLRIVRVHCLRHLLCDLRETALGEVIFLSVIVTRHPPCCVVTGEGELCHLLLDHEVAEVLLIRELVAESETVVIETEADGHLLVGRGLHEVHEELVVVVADLCLLTPYGLPGLVEGSSLHTLHSEAVMEGVARLTVFL